MNYINFEIYKTLSNEELNKNVESRAFKILLKHLFEKPRLYLKDAYLVLSGVSVNENGNKLKKREIRYFLKKWQKEGFIKIGKRYVYLSYPSFREVGNHE